VNPVSRWLFRPGPVGRLAVLRLLVYLYVPIDLFTRTAQVVPHAYGSAALYDPVDLLDTLHQPSPEPWLVQSLRVVIVVGSLVAAAGVLPRLAGWIVAFGYLDWACLAMSYGKVDHDHLGLLVALFVLPTAGRVRLGATERTEAAGWALRCIELAVVATYFLSAYAKEVRFGGAHWVVGATFAWAVVRRGSSPVKLLLHHPLVLVAGQIGVVAMEASTPVLLVLGRRGRLVGVATLLAFHLVTWASIGINFAPLLVCLGVFLPLEDIPGWVARHRWPAGHAVASHP
jgi:hypothetical protein